MAYNLRGRRVAYDNIAAGSVAGKENYFDMTSQTGGFTSDVTDTSIYNVQEVSPYGGVLETGGFSNIANAALPGIEDTDNDTADKLSDGETVAD